MHLQMCQQMCSVLLSSKPKIRVLFIFINGLCNPIVIQIPWFYLASALQAADRQQHSDGQVGTPGPGGRGRIKGVDSPVTHVKLYTHFVSIFWPI